MSKTYKEYAENLDEAKDQSYRWSQINQALLRMKAGNRIDKKFIADFLEDLKDQAKVNS